MKRIYILPEYIESLFQNYETIKNFIHEVCDFRQKLLYSKDDYDCKIILDLDFFDDFKEFELYDIRMLTSFYNDDPFLEKPLLPTNHTNFAVYKIPNVCPNVFDESKNIMHLDLALNSNANSNVINSIPMDFNLLLLHRFDKEIKPKLITSCHIDISNLGIELFFEKYIFNLFIDKNEYLEFLSKYIQFIKTFNWKEWSPRNNPVPAHTILHSLFKYLTKSKNKASHLNWGHIMAILNGATFNKQLTLHNSKKKVVNDVFQLGIDKGNDTIFFSIDTENGNLEIYDYRGVHIDKVYGIVTGLREQEKNYVIEVPKSKWL